MSASSSIKHTVTPKGDANIATFRDSQSTFYTLRVCVHTTGRQPNGMSDNHVSVFLLLGENQGSIRLNMTTEEDDRSGILVWSQEVYQLSNSEIVHFDYRLCYTMQVSALYAWIRLWGLQRYVFSGGGSGCRFWIYTLLLKLKGIQFLDDGLPQDAWQKLSWQYSREVAPKVIEIKQGTWITQEEWEDEWE